jgi:hypothetical protein
MELSLSDELWGGIIVTSNSFDLSVSKKTSNNGIGKHRLCKVESQPTLRIIAISFEDGNNTISLTPHLINQKSS